MVILSRLAEERKYPIQLSHNAISGQDDPSLLGQIWAELDLESQKYSGLTDDDITSFDDVKLDGLSAGSLGYEQVSLIFLPEDKDILERALEGIKGKTTRFSAHAAHIDTFDRFFEAAIKTKQDLNVRNSAIAIAVMAELELERLRESRLKMTTKTVKNKRGRLTALTPPNSTPKDRKTVGKAVAISMQP